ncbi:SsgA family sporulation/cell division regulator [Streptomyces piniterrae]|uniref:SsgA family sporulation/cell division regulator n=1 Tax=Streptomyces piniterrae TaxID=2571125 RepID=A0A4U0NQU7_9ACTN|nr:SsgA family sporulation/cell division regulator [Streptomyces piniterrae]TJZ56865.1 SsgA family sporulation/cell division regulator [Streptomyces piniterrae]
MSTAIDQAVQARLIATTPGSREIPASLRYDHADPFAVRVTFPPAASLDGAEVVWTFGRDLLEDGLRAPSGTGDVRIWPCGPEAVVVEFHTAEGMAMVQFGTQDLRDFLVRSYGVVARGGEGLHLDVDADLAALLREA